MAHGPATPVPGGSPPPSATVPQPAASPETDTEPGANAETARQVKVREIRRPEVKPLNARLVKERARTILATTFAIAFLITLCASFAGSLLKWQPVKDWLQIILPAQTGLFGSALGFYFGSSAD